MTLSIASNRKFGVEIEFTGISISQAVEALVQAGIPVNHNLCNNYNHVDSSSAWKVVTDATVDGCGGEVVSPILSGIEGLEQVRKAADAINAAGATANKSCGLHVHVDARDLNGRDVASAVARYGKFESQIDACMPASRRSTTNRWCRTVVQMNGRMQRLADNSTAIPVSRAVSAFGDDRFRKVNLVAFNTHGTIEIRHHSGTVQSSKIVPWIQFCVNFVEKSRVRTERAVSAAPVANAPATGRARDSKTLVAMHKIVNKLREVGYTGCTKEQLAIATGVKASSCVVYVSNLRTQYGFRIKKMSGTYVIQRTGDLPALGNETGAASASPAISSERIVPMPTNDNAFRGLPVGVASYFTERAADLAAA